MVQDNKTVNNNINGINDYNYIDFSFDSITGLTYGKKLGGKKGISFESNPRKYEHVINEIKSNEKLSNDKIINQSPLNIKINDFNKHKFDFVTCLGGTSILDGIGETRTLLYKSLMLSSKFVYINQTNYDSDVFLFKKGFKTNISDWSRNTNHLTSNIYFNLLFDFYKKGYIEDYIIYYTIPIKDSKDSTIHPLNSPKNQPTFNDESHPAKNEHIKFKHIYKYLNVLITINGYKKIDELLERINNKKHILYDSRTGIYDDSTEEFIDKTNKKGKNIFGKVNKYLNSDI
ncbi:MAG TPA: hypothetical protein HA355_04910 [Methanosphaera sp.]|nr:hypothetical protein [Methanosphaera sp.]HII08912.1 hypothetical protein [Methanosphaera sp.]